MNLTELGWKYETDKSPHGFMAEYEKRIGHLIDEPICLLEIGTWDGRGLRAFREYFSKAKIVGLDINPQWEPEPDDGIILLKGDQRKIEDLQRVGALGEFDFIIDDGGHLPNEHIASFEFLWSFVKPGGWYVIEDSFTLFNECWTKPKDRTILHVIWEGLNESVLCSKGDIAEIHIVGGDKHPGSDGKGHDDGLIFFRKKL